MAPRTRASASSSQPVSASPAPERPTRLSARPRRPSDASENPGTPLSSQTKTPVKRRRAAGKQKAQTRASAEPILEEEDEVMDEPKEATPSCDRGKRSPQDQTEADDEIVLSQPNAKQVHFTVDLADEDDSIDVAAATNITPHIRKMTIKRRRSDSPSAEGSVKRVKSSRTSLPSLLSANNPTQIIQEHTFAPLRVVLEERMRRLSGLKSTAANAQLDGASDEVDDDMLVLNASEQFSVAQLPAPQTPTTKRTAGKPPATPGAYDRAQWTTERNQFHDAIIALQKEADEAASQLRILHIELESLDVADKGASSLNILQSIRDSYAQAREFLETDLPGSVPEDTTNASLIEILVTNVQDFSARLRNADEELGDKDKLIGDLVQQTNGILNQLAMKEVEKTETHRKADELAQAMKKKDLDLAELGNDLQKAVEERHGLQKQRDLENARANELHTEKTDLESNVSRLSASLLKYQDEAANLTDRINSMEEQHRRTVSAMNREREETVRDLEGRLDDAIMRHVEAETLAQNRQDMVNELEAKITDASAERDVLQEELDTIKAELGEEAEKRQTAEAGLEKRDAEIEDLERRVQCLDEELDQHKEDLDELRQLNQSERTQREAAEMELDNKEHSITDLNEKLREQGKLANELRQKLFEVQTKNETTIQDLQQQASERDQQFQEDMAAEVSRREGAEVMAQEEGLAIKELEELLEGTEREMRQTLAARDEQLEQLKEDLTQKDAEIQDLRQTLQTAQQGHANEMGVKQGRIDTLEGEVTATLEAIAEHEAARLELEEQAANMAEEYDLQIEEHEAKIALLDNELAELKVRENDLKQDKARLERRVQDEAEFLLVFQNERNAEIEELKRTIRDKQEKISTVENRVRETDRRWQDVLAARNEEIATLVSTAEKQEKAMTIVRREFGDYIRRSSNFIARLQEQVDAAKVYVDDEGEGLQMEGEQLIAEYQDIAAPGTSAKKGKGKKRKIDSAIGMASTEVVMS